MDAVISDIHGNLEALDAVLNAIRSLGATRIICLGDLVCYGPDSIECVRHSADWEVVLVGDWDAAMIDHDPTQWNPTINEHIKWVRNQFLSASDSATLLEIIRSFRRSFVENGRHFTHGTPDDVREWVFPEDVYNPEKLNRIAKQFAAVCVCGHSHIQGIFKQNDQSEWEFVQPQIGERYELQADRKTIVTAGSVGQPRDDDPCGKIHPQQGHNKVDTEESCCPACQVKSPIHPYSSDCRRAKRPTSMFDITKKATDATSHTMSMLRDPP